MADTAQLAALARAAGRMGIDTEFVGEGRYRPLLCLVQVVVEDPDAPDGQRIELLDPLGDEPFDPAPIAEILADPEVEVVLHAARQDVAILRREWGVGIEDLFDTQIAAGFAGLGAQTGYGNLLAEVLGKRLRKTASFTRWDRRPLTSEQIGYAREDVEDLLALASALQHRLEESGRLDWAREECKPVAEADDERDPDEAWRRLPRVQSLSGKARAAAKELAAWRERTAISEDRPVGSIIGDAQLVEIAKRQPTGMQALEQIRGLRVDQARRRSKEIFAAVERAASADPIAGERDERPPSLDSQDVPLIALSEALVRARSVEAGLAYELLATRADLTEIVATARRGGSEPDVRTLKGWRRELVGHELLELLDGQHALKVAADGGLAVIPVE